MLTFSQQVNPKTPFTAILKLTTVPILPAGVPTGRFDYSELFMMSLEEFHCENNAGYFDV